MKIRRNSVSVRPTRQRTLATALKLSIDDTLTITLNIDVLGRELYADRAGTVDRAALIAQEMMRGQLALIEVSDRGRP